MAMAFIAADDFETKRQIHGGLPHFGENEPILDYWITKHLQLMVLITFELFI